MQSKIIFPILILSILILAGCQTQTETITKYQCTNGEFVNSKELCSEQSCPELPEEKALISNFPADWYINELNEDEIFFSLSVVNYGYVEAKNVEMKCQLIDTGLDGLSEKVIAEKIQNIGNIASVSSSYEEIYVTPSEEILDPHYYTTLCYPVNCDDCEILFNRISEFKELLE